MPKIYTAPPGFEMNPKGLVKELETEIKTLRAQVAQYKADAERLQWMHENICYDGHGYWLPEICINKTLEREPTINDTRAAIDKARKS